MILSHDEILKSLSMLPHWQLAAKEIVRTFDFQNFRLALNFVNDVGELAERADHHPDIKLHGWNKVTINLTTHSSGGLTQKDFELAQRIDEIASVF